MIPFTCCPQFRSQNPGIVAWTPFPDSPQRRGGVSVERSSADTTVVRLLSLPKPGLRKHSVDTRRGVTRSEADMIDNIDTRENRPRSAGPFLTLHWRRKRKRLRERNEPPSAVDDWNLHLDEHFPGQTKLLLQRCDEWDFNTFSLDSATGGRSLPCLLVHLFHRYGLIDHFQLDTADIWAYAALIEEGYHPENPYHNSVHATDVLQAMHCFLLEPRIRPYVTPLEILTSLIAAMTHDYDHPGFNQPFLIATSNHLAALYQNSSVLENHHWRNAIGCLIESGLLRRFSRRQWQDVEYQIRSLILATDITRQQEFLARFRHYMDENMLDMGDENYRHFVLQIALKCADICNPCRSWPVSSRWSYRVCDEFYHQGDCERQLGLPVTAMCDRTVSSVARIQTGFLRFVVTPLFEEWNRFLQTSLSTSLVTNLRSNQAQWDSILTAEQDEALRRSAEVEEKLAELETCESPCALPPALSRNWSLRRHSVPFSSPRPPLPYTALRSEPLATTSGSAECIRASAARLAELFGPSALTVEDARRMLCSEPSIPSAFHRPQPLADAPPSLRRSVLLKQATYPPTRPIILSRQHAVLQEGPPEIVKSKQTCTGNGCGTPPEFQNPDDTRESTPSAGSEAGDQLTRIAFSEAFGSKSSIWMKPPLVKLKSDSDLLDPRQSIKQSDEEKENTRPIVLTILCAANNRLAATKKLRQAAARLASRRGSAPISLLNDDPTSMYLHKSKDPSEDKRRGSLPSNLLDALEERSSSSDDLWTPPNGSWQNFVSLLAAPTGNAVSRRRASVPVDLLQFSSSSWERPPTLPLSSISNNRKARSLSRHAKSLDVAMSDSWYLLSRGHSSSSICQSDEPTTTTGSSHRRGSEPWECPELLDDHLILSEIQRCRRYQQRRSSAPVYTPSLVSSRVT